MNKYWKPTLFTLSQIKAFTLILDLEYMGVLKEYLKDCYPIYIKNNEIQMSKLLLDVMDLCKK